MPQDIDLDKFSGKDLPRLGNFLWVQPISRKKARIYFESDIDAILLALNEAGVNEPRLLDRAYWVNYNRTCHTRFRMEKVLRVTKKGKHKKAYWSKYQLRDMLTCPKNHPCPDEDCRCLPVNKLLGRGFACGCRRPNDAHYEF